MRPLAADDVVRGQYAGYRDEPGVAVDSDVETFCALRLFVDSWRRAGVPWYMRSGRCLPMSAAKVLVRLKPPPQPLFGDSALRRELGYADYRGALQRHRLEAERADGDEPRLLKMSTFLVDHPFAKTLYPRAPNVITRLNSFGRTVILSDGDVVFSPRKVQRSGLWDAVGGRVLIYVHKELMIDSVRRHCPAQHYVMVDDKLRVLAAMKAALQQRLTTVFVRQGHYARDPANVAAYAAADLSVECIGDLIELDFGALTGPARAQTVICDPQEKR